MDSVTDPVRVVIADDHQLFRDGLRAMLEEGGLEVVGEASDGGDAVSLVRALTPDLAVIDLNMPSTSGLEALRAIQASNPEVQTVILTVSTEDADVLDALAAGACGYLLKDTRIDQLVGGIRQAADGHLVLSPAVSRALLSRVREEQTPEPQPQRDLPALTPRELQVLCLFAEGADNVAIGQELSISPHTVKQYVANIFEKLGVRSRVQAAVYAVRAGLI